MMVLVAAPTARVVTARCVRCPVCVALQVESFLRLGLPRTRVHAPRLLRQSNGTYGGVAFKCDAGRTTQKNEVGDGLS